MNYSLLILQRAQKELAAWPPMPTNACEITCAR